MDPRFRRQADGSLNLTNTVEAAKVKEANKGKPYTRKFWTKPRKAYHRDLSNRKHLLGSFENQFGVFCGQTFRWAADSQYATTTHTSTASLRSLLVKKLPNQKNLTKTVERLVFPQKMHLVSKHFFV